MDRESLQERESREGLFPIDIARARAVRIESQVHEDWIRMTTTCPFECVSGLRRGAGRRRRRAQRP